MVVLFNFGVTFKVLKLDWIKPKLKAQTEK